MPTIYFQAGAQWVAGRRDDTPIPLLPLASPGLAGHEETMVKFDLTGTDFTGPGIILSGPLAKQNLSFDVNTRDIGGK